MFSDCSTYLLSQESITNTAAFVTGYRYEWSLSNPQKLCFFPFSILKDNLKGLFFFFSCYKWQHETQIMQRFNRTTFKRIIQLNCYGSHLIYFLSSFYFVFVINNWWFKSDFLWIVSWLLMQTLNSICFIIIIFFFKSSTLKT